MGTPKVRARLQAGAHPPSLAGVQPLHLLTLIASDKPIMNNMQNRNSTVVPAMRAQCLTPVVTFLS